MNTIFIVRNKTTGLYWRGSSVRYGKEERTPWTDAPAKARIFWRQSDAASTFRGRFWPGTMPDCEVVPFQLIEGSPCQPIP